MKAPTYLAINRMGKALAIKHGDTVVTEYAAICAYLVDAFPQAGLATPPGHADRGTYYRWLFFGADNKDLSVVMSDDKRGLVGYGSVE